MAYDWRYDTNAPLNARLRPHRVGWLSRWLDFINELLGFAKKSGDCNRKA